MSRAKRIIWVRDGDRAELERLARSRTVEQRASERARIVLASADGMSSRQICAALGVSHPTVTRWLNRYEEQGVAALVRDLPRSGRPKRITSGQVAEVVRLTQQGPPAGQGTHWSTRTLAPVVGLSRATIHRIWKAHGL